MFSCPGLVPSSEQILVTQDPGALWFFLLVSGRGFWSDVFQVRLMDLNFKGSCLARTNIVSSAGYSELLYHGQTQTA